MVGFSLGGLTGYELVISHVDRAAGPSWPRPTTATIEPARSTQARLPTEDDFQAMRDAFVGKVTGTGRIRHRR